MFRNKKQKVLVAMSGGVDSSVAAALLKRQGYNVVGVFMRFWGPRNDADLSAERRGNENLCCSAEAERAARSVAVKLKIPFYVFNFAKEFKKAVVDYFLSEEKSGRTPNPCVVCNKKIKFGLLFKKALGLGAERIATGHYARTEKNVILKPEGLKNLSLASLKRERSGCMRGKAQINCEILLRQLTVQNDGPTSYRLFVGKDETKDQSYFLYQLSQEQLSQIIFPLGDLTKKEVVELAKKWKLPYRQDESFDLCFVANDRESFVKKYLKLKPGKIMDLFGKVLGEHCGLPLYTIGQRKNIPLQQGPWWVVKKEERKNILYVSNNEKDLYNIELIAGGINWIGGKVPKLPLRVLVKIRYKSEASAAVIRGIVTRPCQPTAGKAARNDAVRVKFKKPQRAITPGQSAVFYSGHGEVLGGGVII